MWCRRAIGSALACPLLLLVVVACGFQPLYAERHGTATQLAAIKIAPIKDRVGQQLHNFLLDNLTPSGPSGRPAYFLRTQLKETRQELAIRKDETATRANLILVANYELHRHADGEVLLTGTAVSTNSYNILENKFATLSAESDARTRAAREIAAEMKIQLASFLVRKR